MDEVRRLGFTSFMESKRAAIAIKDLGWFLKVDKTSVQSTT
jgi:hypothetical protein